MKKLNYYFWVKLSLLKNLFLFFIVIITAFSCKKEAIKINNLEEDAILQTEGDEVGCKAASYEARVLKTRIIIDPVTGIPRIEPYWAWEKITYTVCYTISPSSGSAPTSGGNSEWVANSEVFETLDGNVIPSIHDYLKCLDKNSGASITIYVRQPNPLTDYIWNPAGADIGEVFVGINQGVFSRVIGFYPQAPVNPTINANANGILLDKSNKNYSIGLTFYVDNIKLTKILDFIEHIPTLSPTFNFFNNNNVDFAMNIAVLAELPVESPYVYWPVIGYANSAGLLGKRLEETAFSSAILSQFGVSQSFSTSCP